MSRSFKTEAARKAAHQRRSARRAAPRHSNFESPDKIFESKDQARTMPTYPVDASPGTERWWPPVCLR